MAWQQLSAHGEGVTANPSNSFLYVFTGLHAAHVLGGLVAWAITVARLNADRERAHRAVTLCATYWHFLLAVWLVLLAAMWWITPEFVAAICGPLYGAAP
jgi:cytochrome c oxidase subunit 3